MSITAIYSAGASAGRPIRLTTINETTLFTAASAKPILARLQVVNETGSAVLFTLRLQSVSTGMIFRRSIPANDTVIVDCVPVVLRESDAVTGQAATANALTVTLGLVRYNENAPATLPPNPIGALKDTLSRLNV